MIKRYVVLIVLLACSVLLHASEGTEEFSLLAERATRSYQDMLDVRAIRALVVRSKTGYFFDGAQQRGVTYDLLKTFEKQLNEELETGNLPVYLTFIPVSRDQLIPALLEGRGDVAAANLTITPERQELVDF
jgi:ABC-type amino acid transport substrate-binding protein